MSSPDTFSAKQPSTASTQDIYATFPQHPHFAPFSTTPLHIDNTLLDTIAYPSTLTHTQQDSSPSRANIPSSSFDITKSRSPVVTQPTDLRLYAQSKAGCFDRSMYQGDYQNSMGGLGTPTPQYLQGIKRSRVHNRTPSSSTIASNGPASPFSYNASYPQIANSDWTPQSPAANLWDISPQYDPTSYSFSKNPAFSQVPRDSVLMNAPGYMPSQAAHTPAAYLAMKGFALDHHALPADMPHSSHSASSVGQDSPATPRSTVDETEGRTHKAPGNGENDAWQVGDWDDCLLFDDADYRQPNPAVQLQRTESAVYQDELYNPANQAAVPTSATQQPNKFLSPHRNLVNERLQTANIARSVSPARAVSRERSPFRQGSPLAPLHDGWSSSYPAVGTQAGMRRQQKEEREQAEYAQHQLQLRREPTKTISPKEALLDYSEDGEQTSLFQDEPPAGYKQHFGGTETFPQNFFSSGNAAFGGLPTSNQQNASNFRSTPADGFSGSNFNFSPPNMQAHAQIPGQFQTGNYQSVNENMNSTYPPASVTEPTPDFPAHLTSMESSMSDPPQSSPEGNTTSNAIQRPSDTRAATGTYTCTYHNCTERFESQPALQKHKREVHRSTAHAHRERLSSAERSASASDMASSRSTESPGPSGAGNLTSAALLERNSQAGPHKCTRINPSTGKPCNTVFSRPYDLTRHEDTIHNNRKQKVRCPYCREEKTFSRNDALTRHMRVVHPEVEQFGKRGRRSE